MKQAVSNPGGPIDLRVDSATNPLGIDSRKPSLSWRLAAAGRQRGYHVVVASTEGGLSGEAADLWDSGKVVSGESRFIPYAGKELASAQQAFWRVRIWDQGDQVTEWSKTNSWTMGLLNEGAWAGAQWITATEACLDPSDTANPDGAARLNPRPVGIDCARFPEKKLLEQHVPAASILLRKQFVVRGGLRRATLFATGLGHYDATLDGKSVLNGVMSPGWTNYRKTVLYDTTDVTRSLAVGGHELRLLLGNGMYNVYYTADRYVKFVNTFGAQKAIALLRLEYEDGKIETVATDLSWQAGASPMTYSNAFGGEDYDQRLESPVEWKSAIPVAPPGGVLRGHSVSAPPVRSIETLGAKSATPHSADTTVYDLGQNASIMPRIVASGPAGSSVTIMPSELLATDGSVDRKSCTQDKGGPAYWKYTFDGRAAAPLFPKFFYQGGRHLQVERLPAKGSSALPVIDSLEGVVVHSSVEPAGRFECSNTLFNRIHQLVRWAQRSNMMHVMTDCPAREKMGWLEQLHLNGPSLRYNFRLDQFFRKELHDMVDAQDDAGLVPNIAPELFSADAKLGHDPFRSSPEWGSSLILAAWQQYLFHADVALLDENYPAMKRYFDFLTGTARDHLLPKGLGDWYDIGPKAPWGSQLTPPVFTASAIYFYDAVILAKISRLLNREADAGAFDERAKSTRAAVNDQFQDARTRLYTKNFPYPQGSQCATAMALALHIAADTDRPRLVDALVSDIRAHGNGLTAGDVGYRFVLRALADAGRSDVIFDMNTNPDRPGYAMQLAKGATALTEKWDASVGSFGSQNHFMLGQINEWFFHDLAGIQYDEADPGFRHIILRPRPCGDITSLTASYDGADGRIEVAWKREGATFELTTTIPPNATGTVYLPGAPDENPVRLEPGRHTLASTMS